LANIPYRSQLLTRLKQLVDYPKYSSPLRKNGDLFFCKNNGLQNQAVLYMQKGVDGSPEVLIDPNTFSSDGAISLTSFNLSRDNRYAVYGRTAIPGSDWVDLYVMEIATRRILPDSIHWVKFTGAAWSGDGFYYSRYPAPPHQAELTAPNEHHKVYYHQLGTDSSQDTLVYEDKAHPTFRAMVTTTEDERFAFLTITDKDRMGNALYFRDESRVEKRFIPIVTGITDETIGVLDNVEDKFLLFTTQNATNGRIVLYDPLHPKEKDWKTIIPASKEPMCYPSTVGNKLVLTTLKDAVMHVNIYDREGRWEHEIALPGHGTVSGFRGCKQATDLFYVFSTFNSPPTLFRYDLVTRETTLFHAPDVPGFHPASYETKQVFCRSKDGTRIPMFLTYKKGLKRDGMNPTLLHGYGGFGVALLPTFDTSRIVWLEQGGIYAQVNLRGGGEYGSTWHQYGAKMHKQNVFDDCIAAAKWLIKQRYTSSEKLALHGSSNGGLLVGAVVNQQPGLFQAAIPEAGMMDMLRFQKFTVGAAYIVEYGTSDHKAQFRYLRRYSPLHNIRKGVDYPAILVTTADHDDRVVPAHSFKYTATLQANASHTRPVLIRIETNSGHGSSNLTKGLEETADVYAFLFYNLGVTPHFTP